METRAAEEDESEVWSAIIDVMLNQREDLNYCDREMKKKNNK